MFAILYQPITTFNLSPVHCPNKKFAVTAVIVSCVTSNLPLQPTPVDQKWKHLSGLQLADPSFGQPGRIDLLLGVEVFAEVLLHGRRCGGPGSPVALETQFGWVLAGSTSSSSSSSQVVASHHTMLGFGDDLLRRFWDVEEVVVKNCFTPEESAVMDHFKNHHTRQEDGRFLVPLPKKPGVKSLGESRSQAVRRFLTFERSLHLKEIFPEFKEVMDEYFTMQHAEKVPTASLRTLFSTCPLICEEAIQHND